jgi:cytochrome c-type biogenesis protein CcmH/NrfG
MRGVWTQPLASVSLPAMLTPSLAQLTYEQAQKALEQQERQVDELRQRTGTLLAAAALSASFFGTAALGRDGIVTPIVLACVALVVTVLSGLYVLYPHEMVFATDARRLYDALKPDHDNPERLQMRLAFGLRDTRERNGRRVDWLARCLAIASIALVVQIACWIWALALL